MNQAPTKNTMNLINLIPAENAVGLINQPPIQETS